MKNLIALKKTLDAADAFGEFNAINVDYISEGAATVRLCILWCDLH